MKKEIKVVAIVLVALIVFLSGYGLGASNGINITVGGTIEVNGGAVNAGASVQQPATQAPVTQAPTQAPVTQAPTEAPTQATTEAPAGDTTTQAPAETPTEAPSGTSVPPNGRRTMKQNKSS